MPPAPPHPDRRLWPRLLPAHLAAATTLWLSSRAALTSLSAGSPPSKTLPAAAGIGNPERLLALADEIARSDPEAVAAALGGQLAARSKAFITGLETYRAHPFYRAAAPNARVVWTSGAARLLDFAPTDDARGKPRPAIVIVPSLINRYYILDLLPERSFARHLAAAGLRPFVLDWGEPGDIERPFALADYIDGPLTEAVAAAAALAQRPVALAGYCMGGLLALAAALRRPDLVACLALLATPWDFHAERAEQAKLLAALIGLLPTFPGLNSDDEPLPVSVIQSLFLALDPFLGERKFVQFAGLDPAGNAARDFVALEDWINDGVPLARRVALECARSWYRYNDPAQGRWRVSGRPVCPAEVTVPTLLVLPSRDRIVPPRGAAALAAAIPRASVLRPPFGHIGMMASAAAPDAVWRPIAAWLHDQFARERLC